MTTADTRDVIYPSDTKTVILFGGSDILPRLAQTLTNKGYDVSVFTSPRQASEPMRGGTLESELERVGATYWIKEDIADFPMHLITPFAIGLGIGEAWVFPQRIRDAFGDRLLDFMSIPLPRYRGGAHITWAILRGERTWGGCLQLVTANTVPGEHDDGEIILSWEYEIPNRCRIPQDWFEFCGQEDINAIVGFLVSVRMRRAFRAAPVNEAKSLFLPRLKTVTNGWIDWSLPVAEVESFICAFDNPYPGARTLLAGVEVALKGVSWDGVAQPRVSFQRGLVLRVQDGIHIAALGGVIVARSVLLNGVDQSHHVKVGMRFFSPVEQLEYALRTTPIYTPQGAPA